MTYTPTHLHLWTRPSCYAGPNWNDYYVVLTRHRDSDSLERSNWDVGLERLQKLEDFLEQEGVAVADSAGDSFLQVVRDSHWAVGWVEFMYLHKDAPQALLEAADAMRKKLKDYPVLSEDHWSDLEYTEAGETWEAMSVRDRGEMIKESRCGASIFAARRPHLPQDDNGGLLERLRG